jgi:hypothetical protein
VRANGTIRPTDLAGDVLVLENRFLEHGGTGLPQSYGRLGAPRPRRMPRLHVAGRSPSVPAKLSRPRSCLVFIGFWPECQRADSAAAAPRSPGAPRHCVPAMRRPSHPFCAGQATPAAIAITVLVPAGGSHGPARAEMATAAVRPLGGATANARRSHLCRLRKVGRDRVWSQGRRIIPAGTRAARRQGPAGAADAPGSHLGW